MALRCSFRYRKDFSKHQAVILRSQADTVRVRTGVPTSAHDASCIESLNSLLELTRTIGDFEKYSGFPILGYNVVKQ